MLVITATTTCEREKWSPKLKSLAATAGCVDVRGGTAESRGMWLLGFLLFCEIGNLGIEVMGCNGETCCDVEEQPARGMIKWEGMWLLGFEFGVRDRLNGLGALFSFVEYCYFQVYARIYETSRSIPNHMLKIRNCPLQLIAVT